MSRSRKQDQPDTAGESVAEGLEEHIERTDVKHARKSPRQTRGLGEVQRAPRRAMRETPKPRDDRKE